MIMSLYSIFRFLFEILCIVIVGYWGFGSIKYGDWRFVLGVLVPLTIVFVWSVWGAPSSTNRLNDLSRLVLELVIYAISAICLYNTRLKALTICFIIIAVANAFINYFANRLQ